MCHGKNEGRKSIQEATTTAQIENDGDMAQGTGNEEAKGVWLLHTERLVLWVRERAASKKRHRILLWATS